MDVARDNGQALRKTENFKCRKTIAEIIAKYYFSSARVYTIKNIESALLNSTKTNCDSCTFRNLLCEKAWD